LASIVYDIAIVTLHGKNRHDMNQYTIRDNRMKMTARSLPLLALLLSAGALFAHHGNSAYDETARVPIKGTVTEFIWTNPHSQIYLDVTDKSGKVVNWGVETNSPGILGRAGWTRRSLKAGDKITIIVCPAKNGQPVAYAGSGDPGTKVIFADGRELEFVDKTADKTP
jgi:hypothetical protein